MQLLGNLFEYFLSKRRGPEAKLTILGATSGDTGRHRDLMLSIEHYRGMSTHVYMTGGLH